MQKISCKQNIKKYRGEYKLKKIIQKYFIFTIIMATFLANISISQAQANSFEGILVESEIHNIENELKEESITDIPELIDSTEELPEIQPYALPAVPVVVALIVSAGLRAAIKKYTKSTITTLVKQQEKVARAAAKDLGYVETNYLSHGAKVYQRKSGLGPKFITRDKDSHIGGAWKGATTVNNLGSKNTRSGTYDILLEERLGD